MTLEEGSSFKSSQEQGKDILDEDIDKEPGGNVAASRRSPRFKQNLA